MRPFKKFSSVSEHNNRIFWLFFDGRSDFVDYRYFCYFLSGTNSQFYIKYCGRKSDVGRLTQM